jgi:putative N-acetylmannosamine-6-phosphate epimerase
MVRELRVPVIVEGHISQPEEVRQALDLGAYAVVVGSAITRPESITARFLKAIHA